MSCLWSRIREILQSQPSSAWSTLDLATAANTSLPKIRRILDRMQRSALLMKRLIGTQWYHAWYTYYEEDYEFAEFWKL